MVAYLPWKDKTLVRFQAPWPFMKSKLCCIVNPIYICGSCNFSQCHICNTERVTKNKGCHFLPKRTRDWVYNSEWVTCSVTKKDVRRPTDTPIDGVYVWASRKWITYVVSWIPLLVVRDAIHNGVNLVKIPTMYGTPTAKVTLIKMTVHGFVL